MAGEPQSTKEISLPSLGTAVRRIGPAFVLSAVMLGPGSVVLTTLVGALYGYQLLWVLAISMIFIIVYVEMIARMGIVADQTIWSAVRDKYGSIFGVVGGLFGLATAFGFETGNIIGAALAMEAILGFGSVPLWATVTVGLAALLLVLPDLYGKLEKLVIVLVTIMIAGFAGTLAIVGFSPAEAATGLIPSFPGLDAVFLATGMMSAYFSLYGALYQNYLVKEKKYSKEDLGNAVFDTISAMVVTGLLLIVVFLTAAAVLNPAGIVPSSGAEMAQQLEPLAGPYASILFGIGLFAAGISSVVVNALLGATLFIDGIGWASNLEADEETILGLSPVKATALAILLIGWGFAVVPSLIGGGAVNTLIIATVFTVVGVPYFGFIILRFANDESFMGKYTNTRVQNFLAVLGYLVAIGIALSNIPSLI